MMVMIKHEQIECLLGDLPFTTMEIRPDERIDHLDQRRGADNRVKLVKHQCFERCNVQVKQPIGAIEPLLSLKVMVMLLLALRLMTQMMMVPSENQCIEDLLRNLSKELGINHFGLLIRDDDIVKMSLKGFKDFVQGSIINLFEQLKKHGELRIHSFFCTKLSL